MIIQSTIRKFTLVIQEGKVNLIPKFRSRNSPVSVCRENALKIFFSFVSFFFFFSASYNFAVKIINGFRLRHGRTQTNPVKKFCWLIVCCSDCLCTVNRLVYYYCIGKYLKSIEPPWGRLAHLSPRISRGVW